MDEKNEVRDITHLYATIIEIIYNFDPEVFLDVIKDEAIILKRMFSDNRENFHGNPPQLSDANIYINTNFNSDAKKNNLLTLIKLIGFSEDDFTIYL